MPRQSLRMRGATRIQDDELVVIATDHSETYQLNGIDCPYRTLLNRFGKRETEAAIDRAYANEIDDD